MNLIPRRMFFTYFIILSDIQNIPQWADILKPWRCFIPLWESSVEIFPRGPIDFLVDYWFTHTRMRFQNQPRGGGFFFAKALLYGWDGWMDGRMEDDQKVPSITLNFRCIKKRDVLILNMISKVFYSN